MSKRQLELRDRDPREGMEDGSDSSSILDNILMYGNESKDHIGVNGSRLDVVIYSNTNSLRRRKQSVGSPLDVLVMDPVLRRFVESSFELPVPGPSGVPGWFP